MFIDRYLVLSTVTKTLFFVLVSFTVLKCAAQTKLIPGEIKGKRDTFIVHNADIQFDSIKQIFVYSKKNKFNHGIPYSIAQRDPRFLPMNPKKDIHVDNNVIRQIVYDILNPKLNKLRNLKEEMDVILIFDTSGSVADVSFGLKSNTVITLQDIENIDNEIRIKLKAKFTGTQYKFYNAINYYIPTLFLTLAWWRV